MRKISSFIIVVLLVSCNGSVQNEINSEKKNNIDITSFDGNAFICTEVEPIMKIIFIIPTNEKDSNIFKNIDVVTAMKDNVSVQYNNEYYLQIFHSDKNRKIIPHKACNLSSWYYLKAHLRYGNYEKMPLSFEQSDSCRTALIAPTDSSYFEIVRIYEQ